MVTTFRAVDVVIRLVKNAGSRSGADGAALSTAPRVVHSRHGGPADGVLSAEVGPVPTPDLVTFAYLRAQADFDPAAFRRDVRAGRWRRVRHGIYTRSALPGSAEDAACELARAAVIAFRDVNAAVSHEDAALIRGLPVLRVPALATVTVTRSGARRRGGTKVAVASLPLTHVAVLDGVRVTTTARTVVDLARADRRAGLVAADHALRVTSDPVDLRRELDDVLTDCVRWPGISGAREVVAWADARSESPLESLMRLLCHDHGLPVPQPQVVFEGPGWRYRADAVMHAEGVVIECHGRSKFRVVPLPGGVPDLEERVWQNEKRTGRLSECGWVVVHLTWDDVVVHPERAVARIRAAIERARRIRRAQEGGPAVFFTNAVTA